MFSVRRVRQVPIACFQLKQIVQRAKSRFTGIEDENILCGVQSDRPDLDENTVWAEMLDLSSGGKWNVDNADARVSLKNLERLDSGGESKGSGGHSD